MTASPALLVYDPQCPVCDAYCRAVAVRSRGLALELASAREDHALIGAITARGLDIDQGMVLKADGELFYGPRAIYELTRLAPATGAVGRLGHWLFGSPRRARWSYPLLRTARNILLNALGRKRINNLRIPGADRF